MQGSFWNDVNAHENDVVVPFLQKHVRLVLVFSPLSFFKLKLSQLVINPKSN